eukprot:CAMPEP_0176022174 /NCGR_PEP_ID=MMETSP0120_2-20121206/10788_1 /TAXON_ID=160619 /ORGANISM="Kryptoperidinium foliaceum, Strain CCMP 1326" /LENGTH=268 /DNA_ID=CAMNT_0017355309 /DNA_START=348 /DNA_END=1155 /DNA_ORIENTATION=+
MKHEEDITAIERQVQPSQFLHAPLIDVSRDDDVLPSLNEGCGASPFKSSHWSSTCKAIADRIRRRQSAKRQGKRPQEKLEDMVAAIVAVEPKTGASHIVEGLLEQTIGLAFVLVEVLDVVQDLDALEVRGHKEEVSVRWILGPARRVSEMAVEEILRAIHAEKALQGTMRQGSQVVGWITVQEPLDRGILGPLALQVVIRRGVDVERWPDASLRHRVLRPGEHRVIQLHNVLQRPDVPTHRLGPLHNLVEAIHRPRLLENTLRRVQHH